jgi:RNA polymerase sigma factor (sigma-70 family)
VTPPDPDDTDDDMNAPAETPAAQKPDAKSDPDAKPAPLPEEELQELKDEELVVLVLGGEKDAYRILVERYVGTVTSLAYALVRDPETARDVSQEAMLEGYRMLSALRDHARFGAWVCGIGRRRAIYYLRKKKRSRMVYVPGHDEHTQDKQMTPPEHLERMEARGAMLEALGNLGEKYRVVLVLKYMEGLSYERIAQVLSISVASVDKRLSRAKAMLRNTLKEM